MIQVISRNCYLLKNKIYIIYICNIFFVYLMQICMINYVMDFYQSLIMRISELKFLNNDYDIGYGMFDNNKIILNLDIRK